MTCELGENSVIQPLNEAFERFSKTVSEIDQADLADIKNRIFSEIDKIAELIDQAPEPEQERERFFELCHMFDQSLMHQRTRWKPMGYAGDFLVIDWIYTHKTADSGQGRKFDELFHMYEAAQAVRNRKDFFIRTCAELSKRKDSRIDVLDLGCGSCRDVLEAHRICNNGVQYHFHCVDHEPKAIEYARSLLQGTDAESFIRLENRNVFSLHTSKQYDLVWSAGLFDYLNDRAASMLIRKCWKFLKPDGIFVFGNFSPENPTRKGMELVSKWNLLHRTANQLIQICRTSGVETRSVEVESESLGINLFCRIQK
jgi:extracellular factor (EF) 3-hydroxypalmitic acid methyl ester biosynthesis protein